MARVAPSGYGRFATGFDVPVRYRLMARYNLSQSRSPVQAPTPTTTQAAPSSSGPSNAAVQAAAGLAQPPPLPAADGAIASGLAAMGEMASVVLDALPVDAAFTAAVQSFHLLPVSDWLLRQPAETLYACKPSTVKRVLDELVPVGAFFEAVGRGFAGLGVVAEADFGIEAGFGVERTAGGVRIDARGAADIGVDAEAPGLQVAGARGRHAGFWAECGVSAGCGVEASWNFDVPEMVGRLPLEFLSHLGDLSAGEALLDLFEMSDALLDLPAPDVLTVTGENEGALEADADNGAPMLATFVPPGLVELLRVHLSAAGALSFRPQAGARDGSAFLAVEFEVAGRGESGRLGGGFFETARMEVGFPLPAGEPLTAEDALERALWFELEFRSTDGRGDEGRECFTYDSLPGLLTGLSTMGDESEETFSVGDLVRGRKRKVDQPEAVRDLLPWWPQGRATGDHFVFDQALTVAVDVEIAVLETALTGRLVTCDPTDEEACRDTQRDLARQLLAETAPDLDADFAEVAELRKAEVTVSVDTAVGAGMRAPGASLGSGTETRMGRKADLVDRIDGLDVERLLRS